MTYLYSGLFLIISLFFGAGCSPLELARAFKGEFHFQRNNKIINEYCTSCHIHKKFNSEQHVAKIRLEYRRRLFRTTTECRACHFIEKQWVRDLVLRKTRRPKEANRGDFREFEKKYIKALGKT